MFERPPVRISAPYTGWIFFTYICYQNCNDVCLKRPKINEKRPGFAIFRKISGKTYFDIIFRKK